VTYNEQKNCITLYTSIFMITTLSKANLNLYNRIYPED